MRGRDRLTPGEAPGRWETADRRDGPWEPAAGGVRRYLRYVLDEPGTGTPRTIAAIVARLRALQIPD